MKDLEELLAKCEANAISDSQIDTSELPEITDFSGFEPMHPEYFKAKKCTKLPKMMGIQAAGAAPIVLGHKVENPETIATAIRRGAYEYYRR